MRRAPHLPLLPPGIDDGYGWYNVRRLPIEAAKINADSCACLGVLAKLASRGWRLSSREPGLSEGRFVRDTSIVPR